MDDRPYYYRIRGRLLGPISLQHMRQLAQRVQINRNTDVSRDGIQWAKASEYQELFTGGSAPAPPPAVTPRNDSTGNASGYAAFPQHTTPTSSRWFYTVHGNQQGPVDLQTLQHLVANGSVSSSDYVIREGETQWISATQIPPLPGIPQFDTTSTGGPRSRRQLAAATGKGTAIASMVLGIVGLIGWIIPLIGLPVTITGLTLGIRSRKYGVAIAGMALSTIGILLSVINASVGAYKGAKAGLENSPSPKPPIVRTSSDTREEARELPDPAPQMSPGESFQQFVGLLLKKSKARGIDGNSLTVEVLESGDLACPYLGHLTFLQKQGQMVAGNGSLVIEPKVKWEFTYKGDGRDWDLVEAFQTCVSAELIRDSKGLGETVVRGMIGLRMPVSEFPD